MCVNNLSKVALDSAAAGIWTHDWKTRDLSVASPTPWPLCHRSTHTHIYRMCRKTLFFYVWAVGQYDGDRDSHLLWQFAPWPISRWICRQSQPRVYALLHWLGVSAVWRPTHLQPATLFQKYRSLLCSVISQKFHLARHVTSQHVRRVERVEPCCSSVADDERTIVLACASLVVFMFLHTQILFVPSNEVN